MSRINDEELLYSTDELRFRDEIRDFVGAEILPIASSIEEGDYDPHELFQKIEDSGLTGLLIPEEYGGMGRPFMYQLLANRLKLLSKHFQDRDYLQNETLEA